MKSPTKSGRSTGSSQALPPHAAMKYRPYSTTCCVSSSTASAGAPRISNWKYKRRPENTSFMEMTAEWTRIMQKQIGRSGWFDAFGELHMAYCSKPGQQANGQFFTPSHICELMVMCAAGKKETGQRMGDPTCGSGRLLLAYHARDQENYWSEKTSAGPAA